MSFVAQPLGVDSGPAPVVVDAPFQTESGEQLVSRKMTSYVVSNLRVGVSEKKTIYFRSFRDYVMLRMADAFP